MTAIGGKQTKRTPKTVESICEKLRMGLSVSSACQGAGIGRSTYYEWRHEDAEFKRLTDEAEDFGTDTLEEAAYMRAMRQSDTMMIFLLKARRRHKYGDTVRQVITGNNGGPVEIEHRHYDYSQLSPQEQFDLDQMLARVQDAEAAL